MQTIAAVTTAARRISIGASMRRPMSLEAIRSRVPLIAALFVVVACSDSPTAPSSIDRAAADRVMPSLTDARRRLVPAIEDAVVRERMEYDLARLELALSNGDAQQACFYVRSMSRLLNDYETQGLATTDAADVAAIAIMLHAVSQAVGGDFDMAALP